MLQKKKKKVANPFIEVTNQSELVCISLFTDKDKIYETSKKTNGFLTYLASQ